jgi:hypothetical protein
MSGPTSNAANVNTEQAVVQLPKFFMVVCTLLVLTLGSQDVAAGNRGGRRIHRKSGDVLEERRVGTLMRELRLVNGTLVRWPCDLYPTASVPPNRSLARNQMA